MDLEEWEVLPECDPLQNYDDGVSRKYNFDIDIDFDSNYFISQDSLVLEDQRKAETVGSCQGTGSQDNKFARKKNNFRKFSDIEIYPRIDDDVFELMDECASNNEEIMWLKTDKEREKEGETKREEKSINIVIWKRSVSGVGAICSSGVAATKFCTNMLRNRRRIRLPHGPHPQFQKIRF